MKGYNYKGEKCLKTRKERVETAIEKTSPVGVMDSGVGGLSVLREALGCMPQERFLYFGDHGNAPYGVRSREQIRLLGLSAAMRLKNHGVKGLIIACNTTTAVAFDEIAAAYAPLPVIGIAPPVGRTVEAAGAKKALIMATPATLAQPPFRAAAKPYGDRVIPCPCAGLVELVEAGGAGVGEYLEKLIPPEVRRQVGAVALGCTHYPFAAEAIGRFFGPGVVLVDHAQAIAQQMKAALEKAGLVADGAVPEARIHVLATGKKASLMPLYQRLLGEKYGPIEMEEAECTNV